MEAQICYSSSMSIDEELERLRQENQTVRERLKQALLAIDFLQECVKELGRQQAKDSHNSSLPAPPDRFGRPPKSLWYRVARKSAGSPAIGGIIWTGPSWCSCMKGSAVSTANRISVTFLLCSQWL